MLKKTTDINLIVRKYKELYLDRFSITPVVNYGICGKLIKKHLKEHSSKGIIRIIELYFELDKSEIYHLPRILSAYSFNKYLPKLKLDPNIYENAKEINKEIY